MSASDDLVAFLESRLNEDVTEANEHHYLRCSSSDPCGPPAFSDPDYSLCDCPQARVLRGVEAKRLASGQHQPTIVSWSLTHVCSTCTPGVPGQIVGKGQAPWPCPTLRAMASEWSTHPDYLPEWTP